jgi:N-glycosylase/DNA lyase
VKVPVPPDFSLDAIVASHGWYQLKPYRFDPRTRTLATCLRLPDGHAVSIRIGPLAEGALAVASEAPLSTSDRAFAAGRLARMLHLDAPLAAFHRLCRKDPALRWIARKRLGRLLRSQDLFEDALKTLLTTNCTWKQTVSMTGRLVDLLGPASPSGARAFPGPRAVIRAGARFFEKEVRVGYRAGAAVELAERAEAGELDPFPVEDEAAARETIESWRGFGPYAATALLALLGRRSRPVIDSWAIAQASKLHFGGKPCKPADVERVYARFGDWSGLVAWFDLNRDHYAEWPPTFGIKEDEGAPPPGGSPASPRRRREKPRAARGPKSSRKRRTRTG